MNSLSAVSQLKSQVDIWHCRTSGMVFEDEKKRYEHYLTSEEQERAGKFLFEKDRLNCLLSRVLLRLSLSWYCPNVNAKNWRIVADNNGKPYLDSAIGEHGVEFNISHSGDIVICAITRAGPVGIDIETAKIMHDLRGFSRRFLAPEEFSSVNSRFFSEQSRFFFRLWTLKEAYLKAIGSGLSIPLDNFCFDCNSLDSKQITLLYGAGSEHCWRFWQFFYGEDAHPVALAVNAQTPIQFVWRAPELLGLPKQSTVISPCN
jgi:4'-phosphopantetheinyl transferase